MSAGSIFVVFFFQAEDGIRDLVRSRGLGDVYKRQHLRSEGETFLEALDEFLTIVTTAGIRGEIYHLKASGRGNWPKLATVIERVEAARAAGLPVTADMLSLIHI